MASLTPLLRRRFCERNLNSTPLAALLIAAILPSVALRADILTTWTGAVDNAYGNAGNWSNGVPNNNGNAGYTAQIPGGTVNAPVLSSPGFTYAVDNVSLSTPSSTFTITGSPLQIDAFGPGTGTINNAGTLNMNSTSLVWAGNNGSGFILGSGTSKIQMSNNSANSIYVISPGMTLTNGAFSTIQGAGQLIGGTNNAVTPYALNNNGSIIAVGSAGLLINVGGLVTNTNLLMATDGTLTLLGTYANTGGNIVANTAGTVVMNATINGGTLQTLGTGVLETPGAGAAVTLAGVTIGSGSNFQLADASTMHLAGGTTLTNNGTITENGLSDSTSVLLTGSGAVTLSGSGTLTTIDGSVNNSILANSAGLTLLNDVNSTIAGSMQFNNGGRVGNVYNLINNGTINANNLTAMQIFNGGTFTNNGTLEAATGSAVILNSNTNFTNLSGTTLTGGTYAAGGTIQIFDANSSDIVNNDATILLTGAASAILDQNGHSALANFANNESAGIFSIQGGRNFTTAGAFSNSGMLTVGSTDIFTTGASTAYTQTGGTTQIDGTLTAAGGIFVNGGVLKGSGTINGNVTVQTGGEVSPGDSPGTLTVNGNLTMGSTNALDAEFATSTLFDVLDVSGTLNLAGTLNLVALGGFTPFAGETFDILNCGTCVGTFSSVTGTNLGGGYTFAVQYNAKDVVVTVDGPSSSTPEPGTLLLFGLGLVALGVCRKLRSKVSCS